MLIARPLAREEVFMKSSSAPSAAATTLAALSNTSPPHHCRWPLRPALVNDLLSCVDICMALSSAFCSSPVPLWAFAMVAPASENIANSASMVMLLIRTPATGCLHSNILDGHIGDRTVCRFTYLQWLPENFNRTVVTGIVCSACCQHESWQFGVHLHDGHEEKADQLQCSASQTWQASLL